MIQIPMEYKDAKNVINTILGLCSVSTQKRIINELQTIKNPIVKRKKSNQPITLLEAKEELIIKFERRNRKL